MGFARSPMKQTETVAAEYCRFLVSVIHQLAKVMAMNGPALLSRVGV